ncbi:MAG: coproporphyrinogen dehydrogenase HemZ [Clostridia bacterium]|nr:coproporphyrinogen dehydrogenase HemZ [Clostridia bacterium]
MLNTNCEALREEIMLVIRAFDCEDEDFTHYFSSSCGKFFNSIEYAGRFYDFEEEYKADDELVFKRLAKRSCKLAFYKVISSAKGKSLPWGALTGIRPTKLAYNEIADGRDFEKLFSDACVAPENTALVKKILEVQKGFYKKGGQDLYVSLPFCPSKCDYCSFITAPIENTRKFVGEYVNCIVKELYSIKPFIDNLRSVYIGGGTPFVLDNAQLTPIYAAINELFGSNFEYTVEAGRPDVFTEEKCALAKEYGVNRICVNPQTFNDETLKKIGRKHTAEQTLSAYAMAEKYGFDINIDLIAGLADETAEDFAYSLERAISLSPAAITVHTLSLKSGAKLKENTKKLFVAGIGEMINISREKLTAAGYEPYYLYRQKYQAGGFENVGWAKRGKACVYNIDVMEEITDNIAVGANAISKRLFGDEDRIERYATPKDIPTYIAKLEKIIADRKNLFE